MTHLEEVHPDEAKQMYLDNRRAELSKGTIYEHKCRLNRFTEWFAEQDELDTLADLTRRHTFKYKADQSERVAATTLEHYMRTLRLFLKFCEDYGCLTEGVAAAVDVPSAPKSKRSRTEQLDPERADEIIEYLERYEYATLQHTMFVLMWNLGTRSSGILCLDLQDYHPDGVNGPYLDFNHRPEQGTPLKNGWKSERKPPLREETDKVLSDYIEGRRHDVTDDYGREPLLTTKYGRPAKSTIQKTIYGFTRPCVYANECPHDREISECEAAGSGSKAPKCPSSRSPHTLRRGRATKEANEGMQEDMICDRLDMSPEVFREHYRQQTEKDKQALQREFLDS